MIPDFQRLMLPILQVVRDGKEHRVRDMVEEISRQFKLTAEETKQMLPSGSDFVMHNRIRWARFHMSKAGLIESVERGKHRITPQGLDFLRKNPSEISVPILKSFPEYEKFYSASHQRSTRTLILEDTATLNASAVEKDTPEEMIESPYQALRKELASEFLKRVLDCSPSFFENLVLDLLVSMGYGGSKTDAQAVGRSGDGSIDGIIKEDRLGLDVVYVQAKRWKSTVGRPEIQAFAGSLEGNRARKGVFITTSQFSAEAREYVNRIGMKIVLIDGDQLAELSIDYGIGVEDVTRYTLKRLDQDYFEET